MCIWPILAAVNDIWYLRMKLEHLMTIKQVAERHPALTEPMIRWWIFNADRNGLNRAIIRVGGRIFLDRLVFEEWFEDQRVERIYPPEADKP